VPPQGRRDRLRCWPPVPTTITIPEGFSFRPNLLATTSFDGSIATTFKRTVTATVCDNTKDLALAETDQAYKVKHSRNSSQNDRSPAVAGDEPHHRRRLRHRDRHSLPPVTRHQWGRGAVVGHDRDHRQQLAICSSTAQSSITFNDSVRGTILVSLGVDDDHDEGPSKLPGPGQRWASSLTPSKRATRCPPSCNRRASDSTDPRDPHSSARLEAEAGAASR